MYLIEILKGIHIVDLLGCVFKQERLFEEINGEPDIIKALIEILEDRFQVKYNFTDPLAITQKKAEEPIQSIGGNYAY